MFKKIAFLFLIPALLVAFAGCEKSQSEKADTLLGILGQSGDSYRVVKDYTNVDGYSVFQNMRTGQYVAINVAKYDPKTMKTYSEFMAAINPSSDMIAGLTPRSETKYIPGYWTTDTYWVDTGYWVYDGYYDDYGYWIDTSYYYPSGYWVTDTYWVNGYYRTNTYYENANFSFENKRTTAKDLEGLAANAAKLDTNMVRKALTSQYGFSQERALKVATLTKQMKQIAGTRELTDADKDLFTKAALGTDFKTLQDSMKKSTQGDDAAFDALVNRASHVNGTTPEQTRKLLLDLSGQE